MNKTLKDLITKVQEATIEVNQVKQDIDIALLVIDEQHRRRTRRNNND